MSKPRIVFVRATASVRTPGSKYPTSLHVNEPYWADSPLVLARPELFSDTPSVVFPQGWTPADAPVEQASAAPGEKRATRRGV